MVDVVVGSTVVDVGEDDVDVVEATGDEDEVVVGRDVVEGADVESSREPMVVVGRPAVDSTTDLVGAA